jgi:hypothetical protein
MTVAQTLHHNSCRKIELLWSNFAPLSLFVIPIFPHAGVRHSRHAVLRRHHRTAPCLDVFWLLALVVGVGVGAFSCWQAIAKIKSGIMQTVSQPFSSVRVKRGAHECGNSVDWATIDTAAAQLAMRGFLPLTVCKKDIGQPLLFKLLRPPASMAAHVRRVYVFAMPVPVPAAIEWCRSGGYCAPQSPAPHSA